MRTSLALFALLFAAACGTTAAVPHASDATTRDIDRFFERALREIPDVKSVGLAIARDGKPYYSTSYGFADVEQKTRAGAHTGYYIASSTKSYTGLACAILAARGRLDLDAPIA